MSGFVPVEPLLPLLPLPDDELFEPVEPLPLEPLPLAVDVVVPVLPLVELVALPVVPEDAVPAGVELPQAQSPTANKPIKYGARMRDPAKGAHVSAIASSKD